MPPPANSSTRETASEMPLAGSPAWASGTRAATARTASTGPAIAIWRSMSWLASSKRMPPLASGSRNQGRSADAVRAADSSRPSSARAARCGSRARRSLCRRGFLVHAIEQIERTPLIADGTDLQSPLPRRRRSRAHRRAFAPAASRRTRGCRPRAPRRWARRAPPAACRLRARRALRARASRASRRRPKRRSARPPRARGRPRDRRPPRSQPCRGPGGARRCALRPRRLRRRRCGS